MVVKGELFGTWLLVCLLGPLLQLKSGASVVGARQEAVDNFLIPTFEEELLIPP